MVIIYQKHVRDLGLKRIVEEVYPTSIVGGNFDGSLDAPIMSPLLFHKMLNHIVPANHQLKILYIRWSTTEATGARFAILSTPPTALGQTGAVEAYPPVGATPYGIRDTIMFNAQGSDVRQGNLEGPVHVLEGSIDFLLWGQTPPLGSGGRYSVSWWGVQQSQDPESIY